MIRDIWLVIVIYIYHNTLYVLSGGPVELIEALRIFWQFFDDFLRFFGGFLAPCPLVRIDFGGRPDKVPHLLSGVLFKQDCERSHE